MHVILTNNYSPWSAYSGGGQRSTHNLACALSRRGHDVEVVFTKPPWERVAVPSDLPYALHWAALPALRSRRAAPLRPLTALTVARTVQRLLRPGTVVHSNGEESALLPALQRRQPFLFVLTPRYPQLPEALFQEPRTPRQTLHLFIHHSKFLQLGAAARGADCCSPPSAFGARLMQRAYGLDAERFHVVHNGAPAEFLDYTHDPACAGRGPLVFFGRFAHDKGVDTLLDALGRLGEDAPRALIIGRGEQRRALQQQTNALGLSDRVELRGWMTHDELGAVLAEAGGVALPSREENFSTAILGAMAVGPPVISTRVGGTPEIISDGETGLLVPPGDPATLADAIRRLWRSPDEARRLGAAGRQRVRQQLTWDDAAQQFEALYATASRTQPRAARSLTTDDR